MNMFAEYLLRVKSNIHCTLAMSPLGEVFRTRLLKFPSLVNCCTIDMFSNWPEEALISVATGSIGDGEIDLGEDTPGCIQMFKVIHQSVEKMTERYLDEMRRINYVTPTSYLELLSAYKKTYKDKKKEVGEAKRRLEKGLTALAEAGLEVAKLQQKLKDS
jgi:dynein heavy chain